MPIAPEKPQRRAWRVRTLAAIVALSLIATGIAVAQVVLQYQSSTQVSGAASPFQFVNGANYATANGEGFVTNTYPNAQQVSVSVGLTAANGASASYALDVLELNSVKASTFAWNLHMDVTTALVATGVNAAYLFYCTSAPTGVADTGVPLASGTDINGNPWAIFAPTCAGTVASLPLTALATGATVNFATLAAGQTLLYISFGVAITNTGAATTTPAGLTLLAASP